TTSMTGVTKKELVAFGFTGTIVNSWSPHRLVEGTFSITNNNLADDALVSFFYVDDANQSFVFEVLVGGVPQVSHLSLGAFEGGDTLSSLEAVVDATTDLTMSTATSDQPLAFIELLDG